MASADEDRRYANSVNFFRFDNETKLSMYSEEFATRVGALDSIDYIASVFNAAPVDDLVDRMLYTDVHTQLAEHGLMIVDRTTMAFGLESRSPFLDRSVAEFCASLPTDLKIRQHRLRFLERELAKKYLPPEVVQRPKQGFGLPLGYWFNSTLGDLTAELFGESVLADAGYLDKNAMIDLLAAHRERGVDHSHRLWILLNLEMWYRIFIMQEGVGAVMERVKQPAAA
jgi:asparagine synthase (glutamine-hydrolysing)